MSHRGRSPPGAERRLLLDGLRGVAATAIVVYHFTGHTDFAALRGAFFAVDLFFCLSGFVLAETYSARFAAGMTASEFVLRRLIRLYPLYLAGVLIGFLALCLKAANGDADHSRSDIIGAFQYNLLFLPYFNAGTIVNFGRADVGQLFPTNVAAWSLFFELCVNFVFARLIGLKPKHVWMLVVGCFALYFLELIEAPVQPGWSSGNCWAAIPRALYGFFAGVGVAALSPRRKAAAEAGARRGRPTLVGFAWLALTVGLFVSPVLLVYLASLALAPFIVYSAARVELGPRFGAACALLGWLSYPLYCLHCPIYGLIEGGAILSGAPLAPGVLAGAAALATLVASIALAHWYDEPVRARLSALLAGQARAKQPIRAKAA